MDVFPGQGAAEANHTLLPGTALLAPDASGTNFNLTSQRVTVTATPVPANTSGGYAVFVQGPNLTYVCVCACVCGGGGGAWAPLVSPLNISSVHFQSVQWHIYFKTCYLEGFSSASLCTTRVVILGTRLRTHSVELHISVHLQNRHSDQECIANALVTPITPEWHDDVW